MLRTTNRTRTACILLPMIATAAMIGGCGPFYAERAADAGNNAVAAERTLGILAPQPRTTADATADDDVKVYRGTIVTKSDNQLTIENGDDTTKFSVTEETIVTLDDKEFPFEELKTGWMVDVTAKTRDDHLSATHVDATSPK